MSDHISPEPLTGDFLSFISKTAVQDDFQGNYDITGLVLSGYRVLERILVNSGICDVYRCCRVSEEEPKAPADPDNPEPPAAMPDSAGNPGFLYENSPSFMLKLYRREDVIAPDTAVRLMALESSRTVPVLACDTFHNRRYTVTPFYRYPALDRVLAGGGTFSENDLRKIIIPAVLAGLRDLHAAGIRHGNLSPAAIVPDNSGARLLLADAGVIPDISVRSGSSSDAAASDREDDYRALGLTVYELFSGFPPPPCCFGTKSGDSGLLFPEHFPEEVGILVTGLCRQGWGDSEVRTWLGEAGISGPGGDAAGVSPGSSGNPSPESGTVRVPEISGYGEAVLSGSSLRFRDAPEFRSYIRGLYEAGKYYELRDLMNHYRLALKDVAANVWHSDVYDELDGMVRPLIQLGERLFRNEEEFVAFLENLLSENRATPLNLGYFARAHREVLEGLKERQDLAGIVGRVLEYADVQDGKTGTIIIDGVSRPRYAVPAGEPGTYLEFGRFRQQNKDPDSPKTPVEWLVLDRTFDAALIISRQVLDYIPCHHESEDPGRDLTSLENHDIRKWLNGEFLEETFSEDEKRHIIKTRLVTGKNPQYDISWGGSGVTEDRVFFLSIEEAERYFKGDIFRKCRPVGKALSKGCCHVLRECRGLFCDWWLRSPGGDYGSAAVVTAEGRIAFFGIPLSAECGLRPAMWVRVVDIPE